MGCSVIDDDPLLTIDDIIRAGACHAGAYSTLSRIAKRVSVRSAMRASEIRKLLKKDEQGYIDRATQSYGDGNGYGDGDGDGNGNGYGYGYGDGYGGYRE